MKQEKKPFKFTVDLKRWRCGGNYYTENILGKGITSLLNSEGYMCCLGFACLAAGIETERIFNKPVPMSLRQVIPNLTTSIPYHGATMIINTDFSSEATRINDNPVTTSQEKMGALKELGKKHNIEIDFV